MNGKSRDFTTPMILGLAALGSTVLLLRLILFDIYRIPAESMYPTLKEGDFVITLRRAYANRDPRPGEVVVFTNPNGVAFVKRVIGLPGQTVAYRNERLYIDGVAVPTEAQADQSGPFLAEETLGDYRYRVLLDPRRRGAEGEYPVPEGHYFCLGDSRDNSHDSRYPGVGYIPRDRIRGRVVHVLFSGNSGLEPHGDAVRGTALPD